MSSESSAPLSARVHSPAIKSWKKRLELPLALSVASFIGAMSGDEICVDVVTQQPDATRLQYLLTSVKGVSLRSVPSQKLGVRLGRLIGIHGARSTLSFVLKAPSSQTITNILSGHTIWFADISMYSKMSAVDASAPVENDDEGLFCANVAWEVRQETGVDWWMLCARDEACLNRVGAAIVQSFVERGLEAKIERVDVSRM